MREVYGVGIPVIQNDRVSRCEVQAKTPRTGGYEEDENRAVGCIESAHVQAALEADRGNEYRYQAC